MKGIAIKPDKTVEEVTIPRPGLDEMQAIVGGLIQPVELSDGSSMYVDEEFLYKFIDDDGNIDVVKHFNSIAGDVCGLGGRSDLMLSGILGPVLIVGPVDAEGWDTDITDKARKWVNRVAKEARL